MILEHFLFTTNTSHSLLSLVAYLFYKISHLIKAAMAKGAMVLFLIFKICRLILKVVGSNPAECTQLLSSTPLPHTSGYLGLASKCTDLRLPLANLRSPWD